ncbi:MAG TPA: MmgE/PrpD family protein [Kofleriaceae bacterium]|nr:MmgE/PrpD family protein [Kofleriaceae bacterium]
MTAAEELAAFVAATRYEALSEIARKALKVRVLDSVGCALAALHAPPMLALRDHDDELGGRPLATRIGGGRTAPDRAAFFNSALVRYLDFNDGFLAPGETCHPSDNLGAVLAACEYAGAGGRDLLVALAVAYQVQCRLSEVAPVRAKGFDHTTQLAYAVAAAVSRALGLPAARIAHAIAISGTAQNPLRVTRTGVLSNWKGLAAPHAAFVATHAAFLARRGITGPLEVFEGNKGFMDAIAGRFEVDWSREDLEAVRRTIVKRYNAEVHSQPVLDGILELRRAHALAPDMIVRIDVEIFDVAYRIIGGGEEGDKRTVETKEQADHSLPYLVAVALLDGGVMPAQYEADRIVRGDVQALLRRVAIRPADDLSRRFPAEMPCRIAVHLIDGRVLHAERRDYPGFVTRPMAWEQAVEKFDQLVAPHADPSRRAAIVRAVAELESIPVGDLMSRLADVA